MAFEKGNKHGNRFQRGQSGNPGGAPKVPREFRLKCREIADTKVWQRWEREVDEDGPYWMEATKMLAAYGHGKPTERMEHSGPEGEALGITVRLIKPGA